jgi:hypothetical protein
MKRKILLINFENMVGLIEKLKYSNMASITFEDGSTLPGDAKLIYHFPLPQWESVGIVVESEEFPNTTGGMLPSLGPIVIR